jgi:hypothetical protein
MESVTDYLGKKYKVYYSINEWKNPYDYDGGCYPMNVSAYAKIVREGEEKIIGSIWSYLLDVDKEKSYETKSKKNRKVKVLKNIESNGYNQLLEIEDVKVITEFQGQGVYKNLLKEVLKYKKLPIVSYKWQRNELSDAFWKKRKDNKNVVDISSNYIEYPLNKSNIKYELGGQVEVLTNKQIEFELGRKLNWNENEVYINGVKYKKVFLRPEYKMVNEFRVGGQTKQPKCKVSTQVQSLIFSKDNFSEKSARNWAKEHGYKYDYIDEKENTYRIRQKNPNKFNKDIFRTISFGKGIKSVIACPK